MFELAARNALDKDSSCWSRFAFSASKKWFKMSHNTTVEFSKSGVKDGMEIFWGLAKGNVISNDGK